CTRPSRRLLIARRARNDSDEDDGGVIRTPGLPGSDGPPSGVFRLSAAELRRTETRGTLAVPGWARKRAQEQQRGGTVSEVDERVADVRGRRRTRRARGGRAGRVVLPDARLLRGRLHAAAARSGGLQPPDPRRAPGHGLPLLPHERGEVAGRE